MIISIKNSFYLATHNKHSQLCVQVCAPGYQQVTDSSWNPPPTCNLSQSDNAIKKCQNSSAEKNNATVHSLTPSVLRKKSTDFLSFEKEVVLMVDDSKGLLIFKIIYING